ncbi:MAG: hypothetical protein RLZZ308_117 [Candidatus Parcubacteria bacterium]|jgi:methionyl-tRNA formyltransferase
MLKVAFIVYRKWAYDIVLNLEKESFFKLFNITPIIITTKEREFNDESFSNLFFVEGKNNDQIEAILSANDIHIAFFYGWSWMVKEPLISKYMCICLHPSPLPKYRGGSPIQNQIIAGEKESAVSLFVMKAGIDDGDILKQKKMSLNGSLQDIFYRITEIGVILTKEVLHDVIHNCIVTHPQENLDMNPPHKRRTKDQSIFTVQAVNNLSYGDIFNLVRALDVPYPNFEITTAHGSYYINEVSYHASLDNFMLINEASNTQDVSCLIFKVSDGFVRISRGRFVENN